MCVCVWVGGGGASLFTYVTLRYILSCHVMSCHDKVVINVGDLMQAQADNRHLKKTDATTTYETQMSVSNTYLSRTDAASTYVLIGASWTKAESDAKYTTSASGGLSASGFTMTGDIDMGDHEIKRLSIPTTNTSSTIKSYVDNNFLSRHGGCLLGKRHYEWAEYY